MAKKNGWNGMSDRERDEQQRLRSSTGLPLTLPSIRRRVTRNRAQLTLFFSFSGIIQSI